MSRVLSGSPATDPFVRQQAVAAGLLWLAPAVCTGPAHILLHIDIIDHCKSLIMV